MVTVHTTIIVSSVIPTTNEQTQTTASGHSAASASVGRAITMPMGTTNNMGRRGENRSATSPPPIRPTDSDAVIAPQAAGPPRCARATTGPSTWNAPYQAIMTAEYCSTVAQNQVRERTSDQPSRNSRIMLRCTVRTFPTVRSISSTGTVPIMPSPQMASAQPGPVAATTRPATAAPSIWPPFIASLLSALAWVSSPAGTILGSSACDAG